MNTVVPLRQRPSWRTTAELRLLPRRRRWHENVTAGLLFALSLVAYLAHPLSWETADTVPTRLLPIVILTEGRLDFDSFAPALRERYPQVGEPPYYLVSTPGGHVSFFPIAPGVLLTPFYGPFVWWARNTCHTQADWIAFADRAERITAAIIASLTVAILFLCVRRLGASRRLGIALAVVLALATNTFATASQQLWQHGITVLLALAGSSTALVAVRRGRRAPFLLVGVLLGLATMCRPTSLLLLAAITFWCTVKRPGGLPLVTLGAAIAMAPFVAHNFAIHGRFFGAYTLHSPAAVHALGRGSVLAAMLFSPAKGLLFYFPLGLLGLLGAGVAVRRRDRYRSLHVCLAMSALAQVLLVWWFRWDGDWYGGHCYGPRYVSETQFALVMMLVPLLRRSTGLWTRSAFAILTLWSLLMQVIGVYVVNGDPRYRPSNTWSLRAAPLGVACLRAGLLRPFPDALPEPPLRISSWQEAREQMVDGKRTLFVHAPSEIVLGIDGSTRVVTGSFGIFPGAYENDGKTDGVEFAVDHVDPTGLRRTLHHRWLRPLTEPADRGMQSFRIGVDGVVGELVLQTRPGPDYDLGWDWSYWCDIQMER